MRKHTGMRPHDIAVLAKVFIAQNDYWLIKDLAHEMHISQSEFSQSLNRNVYAELLDDQKRHVLLNNFYEFLIYGLKFVFPQKPREQVRGIPTAHAHPELSKYFVGNTKYVWPHVNGLVIGLGIEPLYEKQTMAVQKDKELYRILSLIEILRVGNVREVNFARKELKKEFLLES